LESYFLLNDGSPNKTNLYSVTMIIVFNIQRSIN